MIISYFFSRTGDPPLFSILLLYVLLTMPVASATAERSFSVLRRLKTYVRSTMKNEKNKIFQKKILFFPTWGGGGGVPGGPPWIRPWRTGFTESSVVQSVVGKSLHFVMTQWVRHLATSLLKSSWIRPCSLSFYYMFC
jgi:hypothetical protein